MFGLGQTPQHSCYLPAADLVQSLHTVETFECFYAPLASKITYTIFILCKIRMNFPVIKKHCGLK